MTKLLRKKTEFGPVLLPFKYYMLMDGIPSPLGKEQSKLACSSSTPEDFSPSSFPLAFLCLLFALVMIERGYVL